MSGSVFHSKHWFVLAFVTIFALLVVGCGGSDSDNAFIAEDGTVIGVDPADPDPSDPETLPQAAIAGSDTAIAAGGTTFYGVALDTPARNDLRVNLLVVGDPTQFEIDSTVTIPAGQSAVTFPVRASDTAVVGSSIEIAIAAGAAYRASLVPVRVSVAGEDVATEVPSVRLLGAPSLLTPESSTTYGLVLDRPAPAELTISVLTAGGVGSFEIPETITIAEGRSAASFEARALPSAEIGASVILQVIAGAGYRIATPADTRLEVVDVDAPPLPSVRLLEVDASLTPGSSTRYGLVLDQPTQTDIAISILTVSSSDDFEVDGEVTIPAGSSSASFQVTALQSAEVGASAILQLVAGTGYRVGSPADALVQVVDEPDTRPQLSLLGGSVDGAEQEPTKTLTPAEADRLGSATTLALVLDRPAPEDITVNYVMVGNSEAFTVDGAEPLSGESLLIPAGARAVPFTVQTSATGQLFDAAELQILGGEAYTVEGESSASFVITLDRLPLAELTPGGLNELVVPKDETRNWAVILNPERPPAPSEGLRINFVLVDDAEVVQDAEDITPTPGEPVDGTDPVARVIEVNNAQPLEIIGGEFAVTFQVTRPQDNSNDVRMILIGGDGYTVPEGEVLLITVPEEDDE